MSSRYNDDPVAVKSVNSVLAVLRDDYTYDTSDAGVVGCGAFSTVFFAVRSQDNAGMALKVISTSSRVVLDDRMRKDAQREAQILRSLSHPNCTHLVDCVQVEEAVCLVMPFAAGVDLSSIFEKYSPMCECASANILFQVFQALDYLHRTKHLIHRDVKPDNVQVCFLDDTQSGTNKTAACCAATPCCANEPEASEQLDRSHSLTNSPNRHDDEKGRACQRACPGHNMHVTLLDFGFCRKVGIHEDELAPTEGSGPPVAPDDDGQTSEEEGNDAASAENRCVAGVANEGANAAPPTAESKSCLDDLQQVLTASGSTSSLSLPMPTALPDSDAPAEKPSHELPTEEAIHDDVRLSPCGSDRFLPPEFLLWLAGEHRTDSEKFIAKQDAAYKLDTYAAGVMMYVALSGSLPFNGKSRATLAVQAQRWTGKFTSKWQGVSPEARDLVSQLLRPDPAERITAAAALAHPWFALHGLALH